MFALYRAITLFLSPFLPLYLYYRVKIGKEDGNRIKERYGRTNLMRPSNKLIWIHAASMGEAQSVMPLVRLLHERHDNIYILFTTVTITSAKHFSPLLPQRAIHQFAPLDTPLAVQRFLNYWQPDSAFFVDSELWPNMLYELRKRNIATILLNGRISKKSMQRWQLAKKLCAQMLQSFTIIFAKSEKDADNFMSLGAKKVLCYGNLKFAANPLPYDKDEFVKIQNLIDGHPVWLAASTHAGEEIIIADVAKKLQKNYPELLTIIVPRHAVRGDEITQELRQGGFNIAQRSKNDSLAHNIDIYVADTMGELGLFYRLSKIAFIGGSLIPHGGQNPIEAAKLGCALIYGTHMHNFLEFCEILDSAQAAFMVKDTDELYQELDYLMQNPNQLNEMVNRANEILTQNQDVIQNIMKEIAKFLQ
jgi:3-deoxy-D-manno-octulosonic-acid transferase